MFGAAYEKVSLEAPNAPVDGFPLIIRDHFQEQQVYSQFEEGKWTLSAEGRLNPTFLSIGPVPASYIPVRFWYGMASYRATEKLTVGTYYNQAWSFSEGRDRQNPNNYAKDVALSSRFDFNRFFYAKLEGHFINGDAEGLYAQVNPNGYAKNTGLLLARVGFAF